jgi:hypothetical protein
LGYGPCAQVAGPAGLAALNDGDDLSLIEGCLGKAAGYETQEREDNDGKRQSYTIEPACLFHFIALLLSNP